ncbi:carboxylate-amine ligase [Streptomyces sp. NRRL F-2664]|uniref:carboxylate-amine ligase n=1 Tax=Streptomyces sp. NRRL F-2664 TaxID=1463842 RepID=UPI000996F98A|nr:glutamate--cysteine ligase [Streptomyces sp. NRRL F-2664]
MSLAVSTSAPQGGSRARALLGSTGRGCAAATVPTMGVEEEFLLVDRRTRAPVGRGARVIEAASGRLGPLVQPEFFTAQVEACTSPTSSTAVLRAELAWLRAELVRAAQSQDCLLVATGTAVVPPEQRLAITPNERYQRMEVRFASAVGSYDQAVCGCHVHIGVSSRAEALDLANRMRPWLPTLQALSANSPFDRGRDSGHASWRSVEHARWPTVGPAPFLDEASYERIAHDLVQCGALLDRRMIYWYARPSEHVPTLEIRVADVNARLDTVVLLAALVRGLAGALLPERQEGRPPPFPECGRLREAHRRAAVYGLGGDALDPVGGARVPVWDMVGRLRERAAPGLAAAGDLLLVDTLLDRLRAEGGGADLQRAAHARRGRLHDVVDSLARTTATG